MIYVVPQYQRVDFEVLEFRTVMLELGDYPNEPQVVLTPRLPWPEHPLPPTQVKPAPASITRVRGIAKASQDIQSLRACIYDDPFLFLRHRYTTA